MLKPEESRNLKKKSKRLVIFLCLVFIFDAFIAFLFFSYTKMHSVLCGFIIIVITVFLYLLFNLICAKLDKRKAERLEKLGKKDPFTKN